MIAVHAKDVVGLVPLKIRKEGNECVVGSTDTNIFVKTSQQGKLLILELLKKKTIGSLQKNFPDIDVKDFVNNLYAHGFIEKINGAKVKFTILCSLSKNTMWNGSFLPIHTLCMARLFFCRCLFY